MIRSALLILFLIPTLSLKLPPAITGVITTRVSVDLLHSLSNLPVPVTILDVLDDRPRPHVHLLYDATVSKIGQSKKKFICQSISKQIDSKFLTSSVLVTASTASSAAPTNILSTARTAHIRSHYLRLPNRSLFQPLVPCPPWSSSSITITSDVLMDSADGDSSEVTSLSHLCCDSLRVALLDSISPRRRGHDRESAADPQHWQQGTSEKHWRLRTT